KPCDQSTCRTCRHEQAPQRAWARFSDVARSPPEPLATNTTPPGQQSGTGSWAGAGPGVKVGRAQRITRIGGQKRRRTGRPPAPGGNASNGIVLDESPPGRRGRPEKRPAAARRAACAASPAGSSTFAKDQIDRPAAADVRAAGAQVPQQLGAGAAR